MTFAGCAEGLCVYKSALSILSAACERDRHRDSLRCNNIAAVTSRMGSLAVAQMNLDVH